MYIYMKKVTIYGERCSGTNYLEELLRLIYKLRLKNVKVINGLFGEEKIEAFTGSDIFCLPSVYDCCPNSLLEALACGLPIITTETNGLSYIVEDKSGMVIPPKNVKKLVEALDFLINNPKIREKYGKIGRKIVLNEMNWEKIGASLENHYLRLINKLD